jgi:RimJ/RimL family protein N-acetyltransferase/heme-degrading monooxygenase HmoA
LACYLRWDARDRAQARQALERQCRETALDAEGDWLTFAVVWREAGRVVGEVGLRLLSRAHRQGEMGFVFNPGYHGRGLATEAAEAMLMLGFDTVGWHRIIGSCDARNHRSARLMERIGMRQEAHFINNEIVKGQWADELVYALLGNEWKARRAGLKIWVKLPYGCITRRVERPGSGVGADPEGNVMFARVNSVQTATDKLAGLLKWAEERLPAAREAPGFKGFYLLADRQSGKVVTISLWDSYDRGEFEARGDQVRQEASSELGIAPTPVDIYEVVLQA